MQFNKILFISLISELIVFCACDNNAIEIKKIADLGPINNISTVFVNLSLFNINFKAVAEIDDRAGTDICDKSVVFKTKITGIRLRQAPKGNCPNCCKIKSKDVKFLLYTEDQPNLGKLLPKSLKSRRYQDLKSYKQIIIYIHGFVETVEVGNPRIIKNKYLQRNQSSAVILLDWSELTSAPWYLNAAQNVMTVGIVLAKFLETYVNTGRLKMEQIHIIGFSLGAHVAGIAGKYLQSSLIIPRITALDPAYPSFERAEPHEILTKKDAEFVDVIHSDSGKFGIPYAFGNVDFYPNIGRNPQPGCDYEDLERREELYNFFSCSHNRAFHFYAESVLDPYGFPAIQCTIDQESHVISTCNDSDVAYMGIIANKNYSGTFYLKTNKEPPYSYNKFEVLSTTKSSDDNYVDYY